MWVDEIMKAIGNHWVTFIITAWVLFYLFKIANLFYVKFERKMISTHAKELKEKWPQTIEKNNMIQQLLYKAMYQFGGDRAYIFEYHNGGHSISGIDFLKTSNTYEVCNNSIAPQQIMLQNLPVGVFAFRNMKVLNRQIICKHIEDISKEDMWAYQVLKQQGVKSVYIIGLYDAKGYPIGFFGIDYVTKNMKDFSSDEYRDLERLSYQISGLLY